MTTLERHYRRFRAQGYTAHVALSYARTELEWEDAGDLVRLTQDPEIDFYDDIYIDTWTIRDCDKERAKKELRERLNHEGHWILVCQYRLSEEHEWETADNIGGFIGNDWEESGYDSDVKRSALDALDAAREDEARGLATRATFAGVSP